MTEAEGGLFDALNTAPVSARECQIRFATNDFFNAGGRDLYRQLAEQVVLAQYLARRYGDPVADLMSSSLDDLAVAMRETADSRLSAEGLKAAPCRNDDDPGLGPRGWLGGHNESATMDGLRANPRAPGRLVEGAVIQSWNAALGALAVADPDRLASYIN